MLTYFLRLNRKILITVLLVIVSAGGGECIVGNNSATAASSEFWNAWKVDANDDAAASDALLGSLGAPEGSNATVLDETGYVGVNEKWSNGAGYYAFQTMLARNSETFYPFYLGEDEWTIYDGLGNPFDFVGLTFTGKIGGRLVGLYVSDSTNTFSTNTFSVNESPDEIGVPFDEYDFIDEQKKLKGIFTEANEKNISFTLLIESKNVGDLSVGGFFELSPHSMEKAPTPEPGTFLIFGTGIAGGLAARRRLSDRSRPQ